MQFAQEMLQVVQTEMPGLVELQSLGRPAIENGRDCMR